MARTVNVQECFGEQPLVVEISLSDGLPACGDSFATILRELAHKAEELQARCSETDGPPFLSSLSFRTYVDGDGNLVGQAIFL